MLFWCGCCTVISCRVTQTKTYAWPNASVVLCGNKIDLSDAREVHTETGKRLADELGRLPEAAVHSQKFLFLEL